MSEANDLKMTEQIGIVQDELERILRRATIADLREVAEGMELEITEGDDSERQRRKILRVIQDALDDKADADGTMLMYESLQLPASLQNKFQEVLKTYSSEQVGGKNLITTAANTETDSPFQPIVKNEYEQLMMKQIENQQAALNEMHQRILDEQRDEDNRARSDSTLSTVEAIKSLGLKRELRIDGNIGGNDAKTLNYVSLLSQVEEAKGKKYTDGEIAYALRRAVVAGSQLRQYLDALGSKLSLNETLCYIRGAYKEKSAVELFNDLNKLCQAPNEDNQAFLFRSLALKAKMKAAAKLETDYTYGDPLIDATFKRALYTGLRDSTARVHLKAMLKVDGEISDKELIDELNKVSAEETEFSSKHVAKARSIQANEVRVDESVSVETQMQATVKPLTDAMKQMSEQLIAMQKELLELRSPRRPFQSRDTRPRRIGCKDCLEKDLRCSHCFKCGKEGHRATSCTATTTSSN